MTITAGEVLFVDTNVLLTATDESRPRHMDARHAVESAGERGLHLAVSGQIVREYLVVATRPVDVNGLGLNSTQALQNIEAFRAFLALYAETEAVLEHLCRLIEARGLEGKRIHDANIAATMLAHGLAILVTENPADFSGIPGVQTVGIAELLRSMEALG